MGNWPKVIALLVIISVGLGFGGYMFYRNEYVKPRQEITKKREDTSLTTIALSVLVTNIFGSFKLAVEELETDSSTTA